MDRKVESRHRVASRERPSTGTRLHERSRTRLGEEQRELIRLLDVADRLQDRLDRSLLQSMVLSGVGLVAIFGVLSLGVRAFQLQTAASWVVFLVGLVSALTSIVLLLRLSQVRRRDERALSAVVDVLLQLNKQGTLVNSSFARAELRVRLSRFDIGAMQQQPHIPTTLATTLWRGPREVFPELTSNSEEVEPRAALTGSATRGV